MTTTTDRLDLLEVPTLALDRIHHHPANPRRTAVASTEMVESILAAGIHVPLMVAPHETIPGDYVLIDGHRRDNGARQAGLEHAPVNVRYDLVTEAQQLEVMVITGLQGEHLTPVEEAAAYEQLHLAGMDDDAIARATGFSKRRVRDRMKLNDLSTSVRDQVHGGDVTLTDVAALDEFADDHQDYSKVESALGTSNFRQVVFEVRGHRERAARNAARVAELEAIGARQIAYVSGGAVYAEHLDQHDSETMEPVFPHGQVREVTYLPGELREPAEHADHLGWYLSPAAYSRVEACCLDTTQHPEIKAQGVATREPSDWEKNQAEREAKRARDAAADQARREWAAEHVTGLLPTKSHQPLAALAVSFLTVHAIEEGDEIPDLATPTKTLAAFGAYVAGQVADALNVADHYVNDLDRAETISRLQLWDWFKSAGYPMSDVDVEQRARLETHLTAIPDEDPADA